jgi:opacity protein-like surface antigen
VRLIAVRLLAIALFFTAGVAHADPDKWNSFYGGFSVGAANARSTWTTDATLVPSPESVDHSATDPVFGVQWGYRKAATEHLRIGLEFSWLAARIQKATFSTQSLTAEYTTRIHDPVSVAVQIGFAGSRTLMYVRGGFAYAGIELRALNHNGGQEAVWEDHATGWTAGAGFDVRLRRAWSLGLQYDYTKLRAVDLATVSNAGFTFSATDFQTRLHTGLLRLNYNY